MVTMEPKLVLRETDNSHILHGEVSLFHVLNVAKTHRIVTPGGRTLRTLTS
jgi:hypothetical protein